MHTRAPMISLRRSLVVSPIAAFSSGFQSAREITAATGRTAEASSLASSMRSTI